LENLQSRQSALRQRLEQNAQELDRLAENEKAFRALKSASQARQTEEKMRAAENALQSGSPDKPAAQKNAKSAASDLKQMATGMDDLLGRLQGGPDAGEVAAVLDETLEFGRWLELMRDKSQRKQQGWEEEDAALNQRAEQMAHWLSGRMESLASRRPFESEVLRHEAAAMSFQADALVTANSATIFSSSPSDSLLAHTRKASRELLKWLQQAQNGDGSGGGMGGDGSASSNGGDESGGQKGQGQGDGDDEGLDGLAGRLQGISGKQMAVNQATYQLLRSMLEGRHPGPGSQSEEMPFPGGSGGSSLMPDNMPGEEGSSSQQGSSENGGQGSHEGGKERGSENGNESDKEGGNSSGGGGANAQQGIAESLERMAESASDAGGAARKLRQLAEEARDLEKDLRQGQLDPEEVRQRQERFQTRLLEATNALEERGQDRQRQAEAYLGGPLKSDSSEVTPGEDVFQELRRREERARGLPLPPEQKRRIESYYETLLMH
jgi:hypothetical protein